MKKYLSKKNHLALAHDFWQEHLCMGDCALDATAGNGHDSLFLAQLVLSPSSGALHIIDIQESALKATQERLKNNLTIEQLSRIHYYHQSHRALPPCEPKLIVYNLGYLPGGDKTKTTRAESTLESISMGLRLIPNGGALSITCYPGHLEGFEEQQNLIPFAQNLDPKTYQVIFFQNLNRPLSPTFIWVVKISHN